ncbi:bacHORMA_1 domain-containing protein [Tenacibaculum sp. 190524A02b]|uniref:BacHORMA_1 domain-containing protein n=1 Tax=Tenacibaculum vairaonense TaxID=3137860 RepID=A0ABP1F5U2_9FLAO
MSTYSRSQTTTYTEARARYVMGKVHEDLIGLMNRGLIDLERANGIKDSVLYLLNKEALLYFQLQFNEPDGTEIGGLHYELNSDGTIYSDEDSGNIDYWLLSKETKVNLLVNLDRSSSNIDEVDKQLEDWGWGKGNALEGTKELLKSYSKDGYGLTQSRIGQW